VFLERRVEQTGHARVLGLFFEDVREETGEQNIPRLCGYFLFPGNKECGVRKSDSSSEGDPFIHAAHRRLRG
jgi:hypothetical protein